MGIPDLEKQIGGDFMKKVHLYLKGLHGLPREFKRRVV